MWNHLTKLLWNRKGRNFFFFIEIIIIFFIFTMTILYSYGHLKNYFVSQGFDTKDLYAVGGEFEQISDSLELVTLRKQLMQEVLQVDGIKSATWVSNSYVYSNNSWAQGNDYYGPLLHAYFQRIGYNVEETLNLNIIKGRSFSKDDLSSKYPPIIMNKILYDKFVELVGHEMIDSIYFSFSEYKVVGVVDHFKQNSEFEEEKYYYIKLDSDNLPMASIPTTLLVKTKPNINPVFQSQINTIYKDVAKMNDVFITSIDESRKNDSSKYWVQLVAVGIVALFLLINISLGLIGILSYSISQRKPEIGLRKAMGATTGHIVGQFVGEVMLVAGIALFLGLIIILQLPYITDFEFEKKDLYFATAISFVFIIILLLLSSIAPSLRGARIEPSTALHEE